MVVGVVSLIGCGTVDGGLRCHRRSDRKIDLCDSRSALRIGDLCDDLCFTFFESNGTDGCSIGLWGLGRAHFSLVCAPLDRQFAVCVVGIANRGLECDFISFQKGFGCRMRDNGRFWVGIVRGDLFLRSTTDEQSKKKIRTHREPQQRINMYYSYL